MNMVAAYGRVVFSAGVALFATRWLLDALGESDYGLYTMLSATVVFVTVANQVLGNSVARQLAYSMGQGKDDLGLWFDAAFRLHLLAASTLFVAGGIVGNLILDPLLGRSASQLADARLVFNILLFFSAFSMLAVPYLALFQANERIAETATWGMVQVLANAGVAYSLQFFSGERLVIYAAAHGVVVLAYQVIVVGRAWFLYPESRHFGVRSEDRSRQKALISYAGWSVFGNLGNVVRNQGTAVVFGSTLGTAVTASYSIANQVAFQANQLAGALVSALSPRINRAAGRGDASAIRRSSLNTSLLTGVLTLLLVAPLFVEAPSLLLIWLGRENPLAVLFSRTVMVVFLLERMTTGLQMAVVAQGKIAAYQVTTGSATMLALPITILGLVLGLGPYSMPISFLGTVAVVTCLRLFWAKRIIGTRYSEWIKQVFLPIAMASCGSFSAGFLVQYVVPAGVLSTFAVLAITFCIAALLSLLPLFPILLRRSQSSSYTSEGTKDKDAGYESSDQE